MNWSNNPGVFVSMKFILIGILILAMVGCGGLRTEALPDRNATVTFTNTFTFTNTPTLQPPQVFTQTPVPPTATSVPPTNTYTPSFTPTNPAPVQFPPSENYSWRLVASGLLEPVGIAQSGDGTDRLFVIEQGGAIRIIQEGTVLPEPFLDIRDRVGSQAFEQGLLGLAFHPRFQQNGYFYLNYTDLNGDTVIARFQQSSENQDRANQDSELHLLDISQPYRNHNGGAIAFGPDGYLYLGLGDGGSAGDPLGNGQSLNSLLGKILRIDVDRNSPYAIPEDNPFIDRGIGTEIWAYGLRNPWRFTFDRLTGDLYIGDVGQNNWEEIDFLPAGSLGGANFGWNFLEGSYPYLGAPPSDLELIPPIAEYNHLLGCSVTGGVVYRGRRLPEWDGIYFYGDYCTGRVWGLLSLPDGEWASEILFEGMGSISSFGEDEAGEVYLVDHNGSIYTLWKE